MVSTDRVGRSCPHPRGPAFSGGIIHPIILGRADNGAPGEFCLTGAHAHSPPAATPMTTPLRQLVVLPSALAERTAEPLGARLRADDAAALDELLATTWEPLVRFLARFVDGTDAAEDIAQRAFVRLWEERATLSVEGSVRAFVYRTARNLALNERRDRRTHLRLLAGNEGVGLAAFPQSPLELLAASELQGAVTAAIDALPPRRREIFILARYHDMSYAEIAGVMEISAQTVANQMSAALATLRWTLRHLIA